GPIRPGWARTILARHRTTWLAGPSSTSAPRGHRRARRSRRSCRRPDSRAFRNALTPRTPAWRAQALRTLLASCTLLARPRLEPACIFVPFGRRQHLDGLRERPDVTLRIAGAIGAVAVELCFRLREDISASCTGALAMRVDIFLEMDVH